MLRDLAFTNLPGPGEVIQRPGCSGTIRDYVQRAQDAEAFGDKGLAVQLEDMVRDESGHAEETERILRDWVVA